MFHLAALEDGVGNHRLLGGCVVVRPTDLDAAGLRVNCDMRQNNLDLSGFCRIGTRKEALKCRFNRCRNWILLELSLSFLLEMEHTMGTFGADFIILFRSIATRGLALLGQG
jgi:hypothetical protein